MTKKVIKIKCHGFLKMITIDLFEVRYRYIHRHFTHSKDGYRVGSVNKCVRVDLDPWHSAMIRGCGAVLA